MKIKHIKLENFRGYKALNIDFDGNSIIIYGINGVGKSSLLRAIDLIYANIIGAVLNTKRRLADFTNDDIYDHKGYTRVEVEIAISNDKTLSYWRKMDNLGKRTHNINALNEFVEEFKKTYVGISKEDGYGDSYLELLDCPMPIFVNYGVNRTVTNNNIIGSAKQYNKLDAFENAIDSYLDFKGFFSWFKQQEDLENEIIAREKEGKSPIRIPWLDAVRSAMLSMFPNFSNVRFDRRLNTLVFEKNNEVLNISQLSDGEKCTIALFGDIARRLAIANGKSVDNPLDGEGIVLIDEVDLHLHPSWQRQIAEKLKKVFPNIQFILTTHSPLVLGGAGRDYTVLSLEYYDGEISGNKIGSLYGWDSNIILEEAMGTPRVNDDIREHMEKMYSAYDNGDYEAASSEADYIDYATNGHNDCVSGMRVMISRKKRGNMRHETNT